MAKRSNASTQRVAAGAAQSEDLKLDDLLAGKREPSAAQRAMSRHFGLAEGLVEGAPTRWIDIELIDANPYQPRGVMNEAELQKLSNDFDQDGQLQAALVRRRGSRYQLAFGHRRREVVKRGANAGIRERNPQQYIGKLRCEVRDEISDIEMLRYAISENDSRADVSALDKARAYQQLRVLTTQQLQQKGELPQDKEASWQRVAEVNGGNYRDMHRIAAILDLPTAWLKDFEHDRNDPGKFVLNSRHGRLLVEYGKDEALQKSIYQAIKRENLSAAEAERRAREQKKLSESQRKLELDMSEAYRRQQKSVGGARQSGLSSEEAQDSRPNLSLVSSMTRPDGVSTQKDDAAGSMTTGITVSRAESAFDAFLGHLSQSRHQAEIAARAMRDMKLTRGQRSRVAAEVETLEEEARKMRDLLDGKRGDS